MHPAPHALRHTLRGLVGKSVSFRMPWATAQHGTLSDDGPLQLWFFRPPYTGTLSLHGFLQLAVVIGGNKGFNETRGGGDDGDDDDDIGARQAQAVGDSPSPLFFHPPFFFIYPRTAKRFGDRVRLGHAGLGNTLMANMFCPTMSVAAATKNVQR